MAKATPTNAYAAPAFSDTVDLPTAGTLFIGTGGDLKVTLQDMDDGDSVTFNNLADGQDFPRVVKRIWAASTVSDVIVDKE